jgi:hypothetical protein
LLEGTRGDQTLIPPVFQLSGDETVIGIDGVILTVSADKAPDEPNRRIATVRIPAGASRESCGLTTPLTFWSVTT